MLLNSLILMIYHLTTNNLTDKKMLNRNKRIESGRCLLFVAIAGAFTILNSCGCSPLLIIFNSDVNYSSTVLPLLFNVLSSVFGIAISSIIITLVSWTAYLFFFKRKTSVHILILTSVVVLAGSVLDIIMTGVVNGFKSLNNMDYIWSFISFLLDISVFAAAFLVSTKKSKSHFEYSAIYSKNYKKAYGIEFDERDHVWPFKKLFDSGNPVLSGIFAGSLAETAFRLISRIIYDFSFGAPTGAAEIAEIVFAYLSDILSGFVIYSISFYLSRFIPQKESDKIASEN